MKKNLIITISIFSLFFSACSKKANTVQNISELKVITSTFPCYDACRAILGDTINNKSCALKMLVKPGVEIHSFDPSPQDIIFLNKCNLFVYIGGESDEWIERIESSLSKDFSSKTLKLFDYVNTVDEVEFDSEPAETSEDAENPHEADEHIWTNPDNEKIIVLAILNELCQIAVNSDLNYLVPLFTENAENYIRQIDEVTEEIKSIVSKSESKFLLMADRFPFIYFTNYYGLSYDAAFSGCSTAIEASTQTISRLIDTAKTKNLKAVYYIELGNHKIADTIAEATGTKALLLQSVQNLSKIDFENGETWVSLMKRNAKALESL